VSSCYLSITWIYKAVNFGNIRYFNSYINSYQIIYIFHYEMWIWITSNKCIPKSNGIYHLCNIF